MFSIIAKKKISASLFFCVGLVFSGCKGEVNESDIFTAIEPNSNISIDYSLLPLDVGSIVNHHFDNDIDRMIEEHDLIITGRIVSVNIGQHNPFAYYEQNIGNNLGVYASCYTTDYTIEITSVLKGTHINNEIITLSLPTDSETIKWEGYIQQPENYFVLGKEYLFFLECRENNFTDEQHLLVNWKYGFLLLENENRIITNDYNSPWCGLCFSDIRDYIKVSSSNALENITNGEEINKFYSDADLYMCKLSDIGVYCSEYQLINTSDDIIIGTITDIINFDGDIVGFSGKNEHQKGKVLKVKISEGLKGHHDYGYVEVFVREYEERYIHLYGEYEIGHEGLFFLSCMDNIQGYHLLNGELQASILFKNDIIYNRANCVEDALKYGFVGNRKILFSDCITKKQIKESITNSIIEFPDRITYGEYIFS